MIVQRNNDRAIRWQSWVWPVLILLSSLASVGVTFADWQSPIRALLILWFIVICPGMGLVRLLRLHDPLAEFMFAIGLSIALATIVASAILYADLWSPPLILAILATISIAGAFVQLLLPRHPRPETVARREED